MQWWNYNTGNQGNCPRKYISPQKITLNPVDGEIEIENNGGIYTITRVLLLPSCFPSLPVPIAVGYEFTVYTTTETQGSVVLCAIVFDPPFGAPRPFNLTATTQDGTASMHGITLDNVLTGMYS